MAVSGNITFSSGGLDRSTNGPRESYEAASISRPEISQDVIKKRVISSASAKPRNSSASIRDVLYFLLSFPLESERLTEKKPRRAVDITKVISSALGAVSGENLAHNTSKIQSPSHDMIRQARAIVRDNAKKASDRVRLCGQVLDKMLHVDRWRKRPRSNVTSGTRTSNTRSTNEPPQRGVGVTNLSHGVGPQKSGDLVKKAIPNKRVRTSMVDAKANDSIGYNGGMNRAQDLSKRANVCNSVLSNDKTSRAMLVFDGWEQSKVRKKRTASKFEVTAASIAPKPLLDGEGPDQLVQQKTHGWSRFVVAQKIRTSLLKDNGPVSPTLTSETTAPRGPRLPKSSTSLHHPVFAPDAIESSQTVNKVHLLGEPNNQLRSTCLQPPVQPVTQWARRRPQEITWVARRKGFVPILSIHDSRTASADATDQRVADNKVHVKSCGQSAEMDEARMVNAESMKVNQEKNEMTLENHEPNVGREAEGSDQDHTPLKSTSHCEIEKLNNPANVKKIRNARLLFDITGSKLGRTPKMKHCERKAKQHPKDKLDRCSSDIAESVNSKLGRTPKMKHCERKAKQHPKDKLDHCSSDIAGDSDNDDKMLLAAANAILNRSHRSLCAFWEKMEPFFTFISEEDITFLKQKGEFDSFSATSSQVFVNEENVNATTGSKKSNVYDTDIQVDDIIPLSLRTLASLVNMDEMDQLHFTTSQYEVVGNRDADLMSRSLCQHAVDVHGVVTDGIYLNVLDAVEMDYSYSPSDTIRHNHNGCQSDFGSRSVLDAYQSSEVCLDNRIMLELQSIGLSPEALPGLTQKEDGISENIHRLEEVLLGQVDKNRDFFTKLEKAAAERRKLQEKEFELLAMNKYVEMAYQRYMSCGKSHRSSTKSVSKKLSQQHTILSSAKRVLERCHSFEVSGKSCFSEPVFQSLLTSSTQRTFLAGLNLLESADLDAFADRATQTRYSGKAGRVTDTSGERNQKRDNSNKLSPIIVESAGSLPKEVSIRGDNSTSKLKEMGEVPSIDAESLAGELSGIGKSCSFGPKGKKSGREKEKKPTIGFSKKGSVHKVGRTALGTIKGDRKTKAKQKSKLKPKTTLPRARLPLTPRSSEHDVGKNIGASWENGLVASSKLTDREEDIDLSHLQLPEMDDIGAFGDPSGQEQDLASWLNFGEDYPDGNFKGELGLPIPMDDLSEILI